MIFEYRSAERRSNSFEDAVSDDVFAHNFLKPMLEEGFSKPTYVFDMELAVLDSSSYPDVSERATFHDDNDTLLFFNYAVGIDFFLHVVLHLDSSPDFVRVRAGNHSHNWSKN